MFEKFYSDFRKTKHWKLMVCTRENSPWHREANVAVHTQMLLDWYKSNLMSNRNIRQQLFTQICCLFHDTGKPLVEEVKFSEERGEYRSYHGHEVVSANIWIDYAMSNQEQMQKLRLDLTDVSNIAFMIEFHVPWQMKKIDKLKNLKKSIISRMGTEGERAWIDFLLSDQHGRISDEQGKHLQNVYEWLAHWGEI